MAAAAVKKIAIAAVMSHSGFWSSRDGAGASPSADARAAASAETGTGEGCGRAPIGVASAESGPVDSEFIIMDLHRVGYATRALPLVLGASFVGAGFAAISRLVPRISFVTKLGTRLLGNRRVVCASGPG